MEKQRDKAAKRVERKLARMSGADAPADEQLEPFDPGDAGLFESSETPKPHER